MDRENLEVFKTLIVKELTRIELEERCYELYEKCILLTDELLNKSYLPHVSNNEAEAPSEGVAVYCSCEDKYISRIETERVTYCQCGKIIKQ